MAYTPIDPLPAGPVRTQAPDDFATTTDTFVAALPPLVTQINAAGAYFDATAAAAATSATNAATSASAAATSATASATSATASATSATSADNSATQAGTYAAAAQAAAGVPTLSGHELQFLRVNAEATGVEWADASPSLYATTKTSGYTVAVADKATLINCSGTFTLAFTAVATLGNGWFCYLQNSGTGDVTLDPNGSETIDGLTSFIMYPGEVRLVYCTGSALLSFVEHPFFKEFSASGTFTKPPGYRLFEGLLWGAGASGESVISTSAGYNSSLTAIGGGGGACAPFKYLAADLSATTTVTIGAGGAAVTRTTVGMTFGNSGGDSTFSTVTGYGGTARQASGYALPSGAGVLSRADTTSGVDNPPGKPRSSQSTALFGVDADFGGGRSGRLDAPTAADAAGGNSVYGASATPGFLTATATVGAAAKSVYGGGYGGSQVRDSGVIPIPAGDSIYGGDGGASAVGSFTGAIATATSGSVKGGGGGAVRITGSSGTATSGAGGNGFMQIWGVV